MKYLAAICCAAACVFAASDSRAAPPLEISRFEISDSFFHGMPDVIADVSSGGIVYAYGSADTERTARRLDAEFVPLCIREPEWRLAESFSCRSPATSGRDILACFAPDPAPLRRWLDPILEFEFFPHLSGTSTIVYGSTIRISVPIPNQDRLVFESGTFDSFAMNPAAWSDEARSAVITGKLRMPLDRLRFRSRPSAGSDPFAAITRSGLSAKLDYGRLGVIHARMNVAKPKSKPVVAAWRIALNQPDKQLSDDMAHRIAKLLD